MPITTAIQIVIALAGYVNQPVPPSQYPLTNQTIRLWELPSVDFCAFFLHVSEGTDVQEFLLSAAESDHLITLLTQLPSCSMDSEGMSFDGVQYELIVMQAEPPLSFHWKNDDWRQSSQGLLDKWGRVAVVADYALRLVKGVVQ